MIKLVNNDNKANIIYWLLIKYKRITWSILAFELYTMIYGLDVRAILKSTIKCILGQFVLIIFCTNLKLLYDCLVKLDTTQEKRLIVDIMYFQQSQERQEIMEISWINGDSNLANTMIKAKLCHAFQELINRNMINLKILGQVKRGIG